MQTIKTAVVVVLLLGVCYGAYVALNAPEPVLPPELGLEDWSTEQPDISFDPSGSVAVDIPQLGNAPGSNSPGLAPAPLTLPSHASSEGGVQGHLTAGPTANPGETLPGTDGPSVPLPGMTPPPSIAPNQLGADAPKIDLPKLDLPKLDLPSNGTSQANAVSGSSANGAAKSAEVAGALPLPTASVSNASLSSSSPNAPGAFAPSVPLPGSLTEAPSATGTPAIGTPANTAPTNAGQKLPGSSDVAASGASTAPPANASTPMNPLARNNAGSATTTESGTAARPKQTFEDAHRAAVKLASSGKLREALTEMSLFYNSPEVTHEQNLDLVDLLDALAGEVIYSKRPFLDPIYNVGPGETLEAIAAKHKISPELLARINGLGDSRIVLTGTQLKTVTGPFRADVNLNRGELTLFLGDLYAGRFPISVGADPAPREGSFEITDKRRDRTYYGAGGNVLKADDPRNPYGGVWMSLGQDMCIHGTPEMGGAEANKAGCISLSPIDAKDVYMILGQGSRVSIHR